MLLIDNGDFFQGTPVSQVQLMQLVNGESEAPPAMALCLKEIGYDAFIPGNHEFNYAWAAMRKTYDYLEENGIPVLAANMVHDGSDPAHEAGECAATPYLIRTVSVGGHEHKIGILGLGNCDITCWDLPANYPGLQFAHPGNEEYSMAKEAALFIPRMRAEGCEMIIVSYHGGLGDIDKELVFGHNSESQGLRLLTESEGIDLLILGHDHKSVYSNRYYSDRNGKPVLVVNGGGQEITQTVFRLSENAEGALTWEITESTNLDLGKFETDRELEKKIEPYALTAQDKIREPIGTASGEWDLSSRYYTAQTDSIDLVSAAQLSVCTKKMQEAYGDKGPEALGIEGLDHLDVDMSTTSAITSGNYVVRPGDLSVTDIYKLYRYDNSILVLPMTGAQIKAMLEDNAANRLKARVYNGQAHIFATGNDFSNIIFGGVNFTYDLSQEPGNRVIIRGFFNGRPYEEDRVYLVCVNNYLLGNEHSALRDYTVQDAVWSQLSFENGKTVQDILAEYVEGVCADGGSLTPELFSWEWSAEYSSDPGAFPAYEGKSAAVLAVKPEDGRRYVLYQESQGCTLGIRESGGGFDAVECQAWGNVLTAPLPEGIMTFTAYVNDAGQIAFTDDAGLYLTSAKNGGLYLTEQMDGNDLSLWELQPIGGGWNAICAGTKEEGRDPLALEYYGAKFTTYRLTSSDVYLFNFYELTE